MINSSEQKERIAKKRNQAERDYIQFSETQDNFSENMSKLDPQKRNPENLPDSKNYNSTQENPKQNIWNLNLPKKNSRDKFCVDMGKQEISKNSFSGRNSLTGGTLTEEGQSSYRGCSISEMEKSTNASIIQYIHSFDKGDRQQNQPDSDADLITSEILATEIFGTILK